MPRDHWCPDCDGMYHDDEIGVSGCCLYCEAGVDGPLGPHEDEELQQPDEADASSD